MAGYRVGVRNRFFMLLLGVMMAWPSAAAAQRDLSKVEILTADLGSGLAMLTGAGGNLGVSVGQDGVLLIDDQFAPLNAKIRAAIRKLSVDPIRFVLNTHWHGDHTGGNAKLGRAGATIVAHDAVRERMSVSQSRHGREDTPAAPREALPIVTFEQGMTFHLNGHTIDVHHVATAHTDGDSIVHFREADVLHLGDVFFASSYPFIDLASGGGINGLIRAVERALELAGPGSRIIPGHGPLSRRADLVRYHGMLSTVRDRVRNMIDEGLKLSEIVSARPTREYDGKFPQSFVRPEAFVGSIHTSLEKEINGDENGE